MSPTDLRLITLAGEVGAAEVLSEDAKLLKEAQQRGLLAHVTAVFIQNLCEEGNITEERRDELFESFVAHHRCSKDVVEAIRQSRETVGPED